MTLCVKMTMPDRSAKPSVDASSAACFVASQAAEAPDTPDVRDVEVFSAMMKQTGHSLAAGGGNIESKAEGHVAGDMPSMTSLMANMASAMSKAVADVPDADVPDTDVFGAEVDDLLPQDTMPSAYTASLLASMNSTLQTPHTVLGPVVAETGHVSAPHFSAKEIDAMVNMLVERIAVSDTKAHMVTVEVSLADTALRGTTLHLTRSLEGLLAVNLITNNDVTFQTLVGAQIDLKARLETLDAGMVRVDIAQATQEQERDQNRRSATYQAYLGDDEYVY